MSEMSWHTSQKKNNYSGFKMVRHFLGEQEGRLFDKSIIYNYLLSIAYEQAFRRQQAISTD